MDSEQNQNNINGNSSVDTELEVSKKQAEEYLNNWKRERADFVNYKKDEVKRMGEFIKFGNEALILEVIEILDDLELAQKQVQNEGLGGVIKKFIDLLKKYGVERIEVGEPSTHSTSSGQASSGQVKFDPMLHEVVEGAEGDNIEEVRAGYTMHGRVIRPARVKITK